MVLAFDRGQVKWCCLSGTLRPFDPPFMHQVLKAVLRLHNFSVRVGMPNQTRCVNLLPRARASRAVRDQGGMYTLTRGRRRTRHRRVKVRHACGRPASSTTTSGGISRTTVMTTRFSFAS